MNQQNYRTQSGSMTGLKSNETAELQNPIRFHSRPQPPMAGHCRCWTSRATCSPDSSETNNPNLFAVYVWASLANIISRCHTSLELFNHANSNSSMRISKTNGPNLFKHCFHMILSPPYNYKNWSPKLNYFKSFTCIENATMNRKLPSNTSLTIQALKHNIFLPKMLQQLCPIWKKDMKLVSFSDGS